MENLIFDIYATAILPRTEYKKKKYLLLNYKHSISSHHGFCFVAIYRTGIATNRQNTIVPTNPDNGFL